MPPVQTTGTPLPASRIALADRRGRRRVAAERPALVGDELRHALVAAAAGIGIDGGAHGGLLGVIELAAARSRDEIDAGAGEGDAEIDGIIDAAAALDAFVGEEAAADGKFLADAARISAKTSSGRRTRFSGEPP